MTSKRRNCSGPGCLFSCMLGDARRHLVRGDPGCSFPVFVSTRRDVRRRHVRGILSCLCTLRDAKCVAVQAAVCLVRGGPGGFFPVCFGTHDGAMSVKYASGRTTAPCSWRSRLSFFSVRLGCTTAPRTLRSRLSLFA